MTVAYCALALAVSLLPSWALWVRSERARSRATTVAVIVLWGVSLLALTTGLFWVIVPSNNAPSVEGSVLALALVMLTSLATGTSVAAMLITTRLRPRLWLRSIALSAAVAVIVVIVAAIVTDSMGIESRLVLRVTGVALLLALVALAVLRRFRTTPRRTLSGSSAMAAPTPERP